MKRFLSLPAIICLFFLLAACSREVVELGGPAPDFKLVDTQGRNWELGELKGQVVFLHFWATWCPSCRDELAYIQRLHTDFPKDQFKVLTVLYSDDPVLAANLTARIGADFPLLVDPKAKVAQAYGLTGVPETYIIDRQGILREKIVGAVPWDSAPARQMLQQYLAP